MLCWYGSRAIYRMSPELAADLGSAMVDLHVHLLESMSDLLEGRDKQHTWLFDQLPFSAKLRCDTTLCRDLLITLSTLAFKAFSPMPLPIACRAEELLLVWAADEVEASREVEGELFEEKEDFLVAVIGDLDFLMMYAPAMDGIDQIEALGTGSFRVDDWFQPYSLPGAMTNPLTWPEEISFLFEKWTHLQR